jgi:gas vesicle protein
MENDSSSGEFVAGFFLGAVVGAIVALLFTPRTGSQMREEIRERGIELKGRADEMGFDPDKVSGTIKVKGRAFLDQQKSRMQEAIDEGRQAAARKKEELLTSIEDPQPSDVDRPIELT